MKQAAIIFWIIMIIATFYLNLLGLMNLISLVITMPLLFASIFGLLFTWNNRNRFKGFHQKRM
ncbi:hypothetical protein [Thermaerobacillus caldiproteolyticus]|uniref:Uncharacterized protein n=1 Tax=Thermaerobacillus caldiproteolyticus TaxID=247480 RepID=A0A7V9Z6G0_9BACL|nr:hypothetical protein [Anoxybacillus caldiproteolyticus]MBA2874938.1 hypothetical protein [Anoxybacillus caldiproteolyticus]